MSIFKDNYLDKITFPNTTTTPSYIITTGTTGTTSNNFFPYYTINSNIPYLVFELPEADMPNKVYLNGILCTMGALGTDVDVAYNGNDKLVLQTVYSIKTLIIDYGKWMYHYKISGVVDNSKKLNATLVGKIEQKWIRE